MNQNNIFEIKGFLKGIGSFNQRFHWGIYSFEFDEVMFQGSLLESLIGHSEKLKLSSGAMEHVTLKKVSDVEFKKNLKEWFCRGVTGEFKDRAFEQKTEEAANDLTDDFLDLIEEKSERKNREIYQLIKGTYSFKLYNSDPISDEYILKIDENLFLLHLGWSD